MLMLLPAGADAKGAVGGTCHVYQVVVHFFGRDTQQLEGKKNTSKSLLSAFKVFL